MVKVAPIPQVMESTGEAATVQSLFDSRDDGFLVKQTMKGWCCQTKNEFTVHEYLDNYDESDAPSQQVMFAAESAGMCARMCSHFAPGFRATSFDMWSPDDGRGRRVPSFLTHKKECTNGKSCWILEGDGGPLRISCCCNLPYLETITRSGPVDQSLGQTRYVCDSCLLVPKYDVIVDKKPVYRIRPDVCCLGACVKCQCTGTRGRCLAVPYYIRKPTPNSEGDYEKLVAAYAKEGTSYAEIVNFWSGATKECCMRQNYALKYPKGASLKEKATLMGSVFLIEMLEYEQN